MLTDGNFELRKTLQYCSYCIQNADELLQPNYAASLHAAQRRTNRAAGLRYVTEDVAVSMRCDAKAVSMRMRCDAKAGCVAMKMTVTEKKQEKEE